MLLFQGQMVEPWTAGRHDQDRASQRTRVELVISPSGVGLDLDQLGVYDELGCPGID